MSFIKIIFYLFAFIFFSSSLYAESMHFDCKCNFGHYQRIDYSLDERSEERTNYCADIHLEIKPDTKQMRVIDNEEWSFSGEIRVDDISFRRQISSDNYYLIWRFDRYTGTFTRAYSNKDDNNIKTTEHEVFRCEKVDKKY